MSDLIFDLERETTIAHAASAAIAQELYQASLTYSQDLGQVAGQQGLLAVYQFCTQRYPRAFLSLSLEARSRLQATLRQLRHDLILGITTAVDLDEDTPASPGSTPVQPPELGTLPIAIEEVATDPAGLLAWYESCEQRWQVALQGFAQRANHHLQTVGILPKKVTRLAFEIVARTHADGNSSSMNSNLLELSLQPREVDEDNDDEDPEPPPAIHLSLAQVQLADPSLAPKREALRQVLERIDKLRDRLERLEGRLVIAQAEAAWRSSWFEDSPERLMR